MPLEPQYPTDHSLGTVEINSEQLSMPSQAQEAMTFHFGMYCCRRSHLLPLGPFQSCSYFCHFPDLLYFPYIKQTVVFKHCNYCESPYRTLQEQRSRADMCIGLIPSITMAVERLGPPTSNLNFLGDKAFPRSKHQRQGPVSNTVRSQRLPPSMFALYRRAENISPLKNYAEQWSTRLINHA